MLCVAGLLKVADAKSADKHCVEKKNNQFGLFQILTKSVFFFKLWHQTVFALPGKAVFALWWLLSSCRKTFISTKFYIHNFILVFLVLGKGGQKGLCNRGNLRGTECETAVWKKEVGGGLGSSGWTNWSVPRRTYLGGPLSFSNQMLRAKCSYGGAGRPDGRGSLMFSGYHSDRRAIFWEVFLATRSRVCMGLYWGPLCPLLLPRVPIRKAGPGTRALLFLLARLGTNGKDDLRVWPAANGELSRGHGVMLSWQALQGNGLTNPVVSWSSTRTTRHRGVSFSMLWELRAPPLAILLQKAHLNRHFLAFTE